MSSAAWRTQVSSKVRELRFVVCQKSDHSAGTRQFIRNNYWDLKTKNPNFPFIVRECEGAQPTVMARYEYGVERSFPVEHLSETQIEQVVEELVNQADEVNSYVQFKPL